MHFKNELFFVLFFLNFYTHNQYILNDCIIEKLVRVNTEETIEDYT